MEPSSPLARQNGRSSRKPLKSSELDDVDASKGPGYGELCMIQSFSAPAQVSSMEYYSAFVIEPSSTKFSKVIEVGRALDDASNEDSEICMRKSFSVPAPQSTCCNSRFPSLQNRRRFQLAPVVVSQVSAVPNFAWTTVLDEGFDVSKTVGYGSTCNVLSGTRRCDNKQVAVKQYLLRQDAELIRREFDILKKLKHPNVVDVLDAGLIRGHSAIVLEFVAGKNLADHVSSLHGGVIDEPVAWPIFLKLVNAVEYIHEQRIIHRDIKPENIIVTENCNDCRLVDFGSACDLSKMTPLTPVCTRAYASPEVMAGGSPDHASDVWGIGLCLLIMLAGHLKFDYSATHWDVYPARCGEVLSRCLKPDHLERPWASDILRGLTCH